MTRHHHDANDDLSKCKVDFTSSVGMVESPGFVGDVRQSLGLSRAELGMLLNVSSITIAGWEKSGIRRDGIQAKKCMNFGILVGLLSQAAANAAGNDDEKSGTLLECILTPGRVRDYLRFAAKGGLASMYFDVPGMSPRLLDALDRRTIGSALLAMLLDMALIAKAPDGTAVAPRIDAVSKAEKGCERNILKAFSSLPPLPPLRGRKRGVRRNVPVAGRND
jgi:hypothetical protein